MNAYVLDARHSERAGNCDAHKGYVTDKQAVSKLLIKRDDGSAFTVRLCRRCARALARNARTWSQT